MNSPSERHSYNYHCSEQIKLLEKQKVARKTECCTKVAEYFVDRPKTGEGKGGGGGGEEEGVLPA